MSVRSSPERAVCCGINGTITPCKAPWLKCVEHSGQAIESIESTESTPKVAMYPSTTLAMLPLFGLFLRSILVVLSSLYGAPNGWARWEKQADACRKCTLVSPSLRLSFPADRPHNLPADREHGPGMLSLYCVHSAKSNSYTSSYGRKHSTTFGSNALLLSRLPYRIPRCFHTVLLILSPQPRCSMTSTASSMMIFLNL